MGRYFVRRKLVTMVIYMTLLTMGGHVRSQSNEKKIIDVILADYDKRVRPVSVDSTVTMVTLDLTLTHIIDMQNKKQVLNMLVYMTLVWEDELLHWYPPDYGNVDRIVIPASDIWIPDIRLWNSVADSVDNTAANVLVSVKSNGMVTLAWRPLFVEIACRVSVRSFPLDSQVCDIPFGSWAYDVTQLDIRPGPRTANVSDFNDLGEFTIGNIASRTSLKLANDGRAFRVVHTTVILKRKQQLYITCYLIPCILIDLMMVISFIIPYQYGVQKISMGVTLFLTGIVYLQSLIKILPATTDQQILLSEYYLSMLIVLSSGTLLNVFSLIVAHSGRDGKREVPCLIRKMFCIDSSCQNVGKGRQTASFEGKLTNHSAMRMRRQSVESTREHTPLEHTLVNIEAITEGISDTLLKQERSVSQKARVDGEWKMVAKMLDRFFLVGYLIEIVVVNSYTVHRAHVFVDSYANFNNTDSWNIM